MFRTLAAIELVGGILSGQIPESTRKLLAYDSTAPLNLTRNMIE